MIALLGLTLLAFMLEIFPMEVTAFGLLAALILFGLVDLEQAMSGLSNPAVVTIGCLFIMSHALTKTGLLEVGADKLGRAVGARKWLGIALLLIVVSVASGFLSNTAIVAIFMPLAIHLSRKFGISPSKILLPLSYAAIVGGTLTLIGTSTNLLVNSFMIEAGQKPIGMFEFTKLGAIYTVLGLTYVIIFAARLLPSRAGISSLTHKYHMGTYLTEVVINADSALLGKNLLESKINLNYDITVLAIIRNGERYHDNLRNFVFEQDDVLIVRGLIDNIMSIRKEQGVALLADIKLTDDELSQENQLLAEGLVAQGSSLIGRSLREIDFRRHYGAFVLAIRRHSTTLREEIAHIAMQFSDTLLILAPRDRIEELRRSDDLIIISEVNAQLRRDKLWWLVLVLLPVLLILVSLGYVSILQGAVLTVAALLLSRALDVQAAYGSVNWSVLFLIAAFVPVGYAMSQTGTSQFIAGGITNLAMKFPAAYVPHIALALIYLATALLTEMVSNNATAIMVAPIAISLAAALDVDARPFLVAVAFASSASFMTPMSYQTNMMVYGPGSYKFRDYVRFGVTLSLTLWIVGSLMIPAIWPF